MPHSSYPLSGSPRHGGWSCWPTGPGLTVTHPVALTQPRDRASGGSLHPQDLRRTVFQGSLIADAPFTRSWEVVCFSAVWGQYSFYEINSASAQPVPLSPTLCLHLFMDQILCPTAAFSPVTLSLCLSLTLYPTRALICTHTSPDPYHTPPPPSPYFTTVARGGGAEELCGPEIATSKGEGTGVAHEWIDNPKAQLCPRYLSATFKSLTEREWCWPPMAASTCRLALQGWCTGSSAFPTPRASGNTCPDPKHMP